MPRISVPSFPPCDVGVITYCTYRATSVGVITYCTHRDSIDATTKRHIAVIQK
jgi:hypothetical protein